MALNGGAIPVCVVSSPEKAELCRRMGAELVIDRAAEGFRFWKDEQTQDPDEWRRFGERIRELTGGEDPDIVFEHPGRETFGASVYVAKRGGTIVTCASTSGYQHQYDNRYLWMHLKRIVGSHFANYREAWEANRLVALGRIHPTCPAPTRWSRPARPRTRCTATPTRARSACAASRPPTGSACATRRCGPGTRTRSTGSADELTADSGDRPADPDAFGDRNVRRRPFRCITKAGTRPFRSRCLHPPGPAKIAVVRPTAELTM